MHNDSYSLLEVFCCLEPEAELLVFLFLAEEEVEVLLLHLLDDCPSQLVFFR